LVINATDLSVSSVNQTERFQKAFHAGKNEFSKRKTKVKHFFHFGGDLVHGTRRT